MSGLIDVWTTEMAKVKDKGMPYFHLDRRELQRPNKSSQGTTAGHDGAEAGTVHNQYHNTQQQLQERYPVLSQALRIKTSTSNGPLISNEALHMVFDCSSA